MRMVPTYRPGASALHAARAGVAAAFCGALALAAALYANPIVLASVLTAIVLAGVAAGVGRELWLSLRLALPFVLLVAIVNPLVYQGGDTLLFRGGEILGRRVDITLEAAVQGGLAGLRIAAIVVAFGLLSAAVDPDELLRLFRRVSYRSALTASLATRLVPVLERDALRRGDAARCRPQPPGRLAMARLVLAGTLDRAVDMAAALEVRGYALAGRPVAERRTWSRHDVRVGLAALAIATVALSAKLAGAGAVDCYPTVDVDTGSLTLALAVALPLLALSPFVGRSARLGVRRG
jgi:energy-coupling factor transport system permease protein